MVSIMDIEPKRQICDNRSTLSQSAVSQKAVDLEIPIPLKSPTSTTSPTPSATTSPLSSTGGGTASGTLSPTTTATVVITDTELAKRAMKLDLNDSSQQGSSSATPVTAVIASTSGGTTSAASTTTSTAAAGAGTAGAANTAAHSSSTTSNSVATGTTTSSTAAIIMKHRKLKERTFSDELGSPKSPAAAIGRSGTTLPAVVPRQTSLTSQSDVVDDRKALRDALYQGIFHRHRRTIFAVGSFLRMLKSRNSSYNTIRSSSEGEDDTR